jgi:hypothetical protein
MHHRDHLIGTSRIVVRIGLVLNRLFLVAVSFGLLLSWLFATGVTDFLIRSTPGGDAPSDLIGLRFEMLIGVVMAIVTDRLLNALGHMIESARAGNPFIVANARRLQTIGWALLVLQLLDIGGVLLGKTFPSLGSAAPNGDFSAGGWVAVLMVFILSRVFSAGAVMRDELEGTI